MPQGDMNVANDSGANVRADINNQLAALVQISSGASAPGTTFAHMLWADTTPTGYTIIKIRNAADSAFSTLFDDEGNWKGVDGSAAAPSVSFGADIDTGLYRIGADQLGIATGGTLAVSIGAGQVVTTSGSLISLGTTISVQNAAAGTNVILAVTNQDGTDTASGAAVDVAVAGAGSGDPFISFLVGGAQSYVLGIDNSDSDKFVGSVGAAIGTSNWLEVDTSGDVTLTGMVGVGISPLANMATGDIVIEGGSLALKEITTPTADLTYGKFYFKSDNKAYVQTGDGVEHELAFV